VELGQLAFIAVMLALRRLVSRTDEAVKHRLSTFGYYAMGSLAMYWFFERVSAYSG
jgi:hypothetical protein